MRAPLVLTGANSVGIRIKMETVMSDQQIKMTLNGHATVASMDAMVNVFLDALACEQALVWVLCTRCETQVVKLRERGAR